MTTSLQHYTRQALRQLAFTNIELSIHKTLKLREIIHFSKIHSPWYRDKLGSLDPEEVTLENMDQLIPSITKYEYMNNWDDICTDRSLKKIDILKFLENEKNRSESTYLFKNKYHIISTSGSSGMAGFYLYDSNEWLQYCSQYAKYNLDVSLNSLKIANLTVKSQLFASPRSTKTIMDSVKDYESIDFQEIDFIGDPDNAINILNHMLPDVLVTLPSILQKLCHLKENGDLKISPKIINVSAEPLNSGLRQRVECAFKQCKLVNIYGGSEGFTALNCPNNPSKMHLSEDFCIFDLTCDSHISVTNLFLKTTPLLRFQVDDKIEKIDAIQCEDCGTYFQSIKEPQGRYSEDFIYENGSRIAPIEIIEIMNHFPQIIEFQAIQTKKGITLYTTDSSLHVNDKISAFIKALALKKCLDDLHIIIQYKQFIERKPSGKLIQFIPLRNL